MRSGNDKTSNRDNAEEESSLNIDSDDYVGDESLDSYNESEEELTEELIEVTFESDFTLVKKLKSGMTGDVEIRRYNGADPNILRLVDEDGSLVIKTLKFSFDQKENKHAKKTFRNECENITELNLKNNVQNANPQLPKTHVAVYEDIKYILNECIYNDKQAKTAISLHQYIQDMGNNCYGESRFHDVITQFDNIFNGVVHAQAALHETGLLHLDSQPQNFMLKHDGSIVIIDFGASYKMDAVGISLKNEKFPLTPYSYYNKAALADENNPICYSIATDKFSVRMCMMKTVSVYLGCPNLFNLVHREQFGINKEDPSSFAKLSQISDEARLNAMFNKLNELAEQDDNSIKKNIALAILEKYKPYLTSFNYPSNNAFKEFMQNDMNLFNECLAKPAHSATASLHHHSTTTSLYQELGITGKQNIIDKPRHSEERKTEESKNSSRKQKVVSKQAKDINESKKSEKSSSDDESVNRHTPH